MIGQLLSELREKNIRIWVEGDRVKYEAAPGALTDDFLARLRLHKPAILQYYAQLDKFDLTSIPKVARDKPPQLSFAQERMWFLWRLSPDSPAYNIPTVVKLTGPLNLAALRQSLCTIRKRHEILRTYYAEAADGPCQMVTDDAELHVSLTDLTGIRREDADAAARRRMHEELVKPFDLTKAAPFEAHLYRLAENLHWFLIKLHHIVFDGWSNRILMEELFSLYRSLDRGEPARLDELPIQYADFGAWQRTRFQGPLRERLLSYWKQQLGGELIPLKLPTDRPRPPYRRMQGHIVPFQLPADLSARLAALGHSQQATRFMILMCGFRILLSRYSGQTDFLIGTPTIWRNHSDTEKLIGYFGNTLILRNPLLPTDTYLDALARERRTALASYEYQEIPFEALVEELSPDRDLSQSPLFQAMFLFGERAQHTDQIGELLIEFSELATPTAKFDIGLWITERAAGLVGHIEYDSELFERETIARMAAHLEMILTAMVDHPSSRIYETPLLTAQEQRWLQEWNATRRPSSSASAPCLQQRFEAQALASPGAAAIHWGDATISYRELNEQANQWAGRLLRQNVQVEQRVGVFMRRSPNLIAALIGVLKTGAAYVPIDPNYPPDHIARILDESGVTVLLTERTEMHRLPEQARNAILIDEALSAGDGPCAGNPAVRIEPGNLAYVLYTSGSTGRPKGVMIEHRSASALLDWAYETYSAEELAGVLAATSICFDLSIFEIFVPLCAGHAMILAENIMEMPSLARRDAITLVNTVPSVMQALLAAHADAFPASLKVVNLAGEYLEIPLVDEVYRRTHVTKVYDLYGPTEATTYALFTLRLPQQPASIGRPISNTRAYVLDRNGVQTPVGVVGELYLGGAGLARGYLNRPDHTGERFVPLGLASAEDRVYRTGDLVRYRRNGELEYHGRIDDQVKIRGFRIEPGQVKSAILSVKGVKNAAVVSHRHANGEAFLAAYIVGDATSADEHIRHHLRKLLPDYMIPAIFVKVDALPLSSNGKPDLARLRPPAAPGAAGAEDLGNDTERRILDVWTALLATDRIGRHDNFFELGGNSLTAMRATARINQAFEIDMPLRTIFQFPTICELATEVDALPRGVRTALPPIVATPAGDAPLTLLQRHFGFIDSVVKDSAFLNLSRSIGLRGQFDLAAADQALRMLVARHRILQSRFIFEGREFTMHSDTDIPLELDFEDLSGLSGDARQHEALGEALYRAGRPFDISSGPCSRFVIIKLSNTHHVLHVVLHHIISDEWSIALVVAEFATNYGLLINKVSIPEQPPAIDFADYSAWERDCLAEGRFEAQLTYWKEQLQPPLERLRFSWRDESSRHKRTHPLAIDATLSENLAAVARREGTSMFVVLLSALNRLLQVQTGQSDIRICTNHARRYRSNLQDVIGPLIDTLILRTWIEPDATPLAALHAVRRTFVTASGYQDVPFEEVASRLTSDLAVKRRDLAQVFFHFHEDAQAMPPVPGLSPEGAPVFGEDNFFETALHDYAVILYLFRVPDGIRGQLTLQGHLEEEPVGAELIRDYERRLRELIHDQPAIPF